MKYEPLRYAHDNGHTDVCFFEDGEKFVTCGADGDIRIWSTDDTVDPIHSCVGEWASAVGQMDDKLYVGTSNNDVQILSLPEGERDGVLDRFIAQVNHIAVTRRAQLIALAGEDMEAKLMDLSKKPKEVTVFGGGTSGPCLSVAMCPNSQFLAAAFGDGNLKVWDIKSKNLVKELTCFHKVNSFSNAKMLCRMDFEPTKGMLLAYPEKNAITILHSTDWSKMTTLGSEEVSANFSIVKFSPCGEFILAASIEGDFVLWQVNTENVLEVCKHENSAPICGLAWNPKSNGEVVFTDKEGQMGVFKELIKVQTVTNQETEDTTEAFDDMTVPYEGDVADEDDDNENAVCIEQLKRQYLGSPEPELTDLAGGSSRSSTPRPRTPEIPLQSSFMPSSTPEHLDPRYMCWNDVGVIRCYGDNASSKSIEVEFHDTNFHNSMMLQNYQEYTLGTLSKSALVVANANQIIVIPLAASSKEWDIKVNESEEIVLVAASENLICFAMANYIIRICSIYGTQRGVVSIPGPLVSMSAYKNSLMIAYHSGGVKGEDQSISIKMFTVKDLSITSKDMTSALGPKSTLSWLGFSDVGTPAMMDSLGMLSLFPASCDTWIPFCDTSKHHKSPADHFFVTTVFESYQAVGGIKCKGTIYPGFTPRPTMSEIPLEPPFAESENEKAQWEMKLFTWSNLQISGVEKRFIETALKTFALACRNDLDERAVEFMEILSNPQLMMLGLKFASKIEKRRVVQRLTDLVNRLTEETEDKLLVREEVQPQPSISRPKKLHLNKPREGKQFGKNRGGSAVVETPKSDPEPESTPNDEGDVETFTNLTSTTDSQDISTYTEEEPIVNPFLKSSKKPQVEKPMNPLSLMNKFAGVSYEKENKDKNLEVPSGSKRKLMDSEKSNGKQRKLDSFKFGKKTN